MGDKDSGGGFGIGFIMGAIVGVAIGFLYAPKAGSETRELLKEKTKEFKEKAGETAEKARGVTTSVRKKVEERGRHEEAET